MPKRTNFLRENHALNARFTVVIEKYALVKLGRMAKRRKIPRGQLAREILMATIDPETDVTSSDVDAADQVLAS